MLYARVVYNVLRCYGGYTTLTISLLRRRAKTSSFFFVGRCGNKSCGSHVLFNAKDDEDEGDSEADAR